MNIRDEIRGSIDQVGISIRQLSIQSGVRRQSIINFLNGGNIHLDNLSKILEALDLDIKLIKKTRNQNQLIKERLSTDPTKISRFCKKNKINFLAVFGSILRKDFTKKSDIDVLIKLDKPISFFELFEIEKELKQLFKTEHELDV
ncbi:nucleotidyltransferase domain-containing protein, partial [bacterium]|nr:nucleotidyltransferase domain-containing protein [bacterium]